LEHIIRFTKTERIQHILLFLSIIVLGITGFSLKYSDTSFGRWLIQFEGGIQSRGILHRISAVVLTGTACWHFLYILFSRLGHHDFMEMMWRKKDGNDFIISLRNLFSRLEKHISYNKFTYWQKIQYWIVVIGTITMIITGIALWFETTAMLLLPKYIMDIILILHGEEALLLILVLFFWHFYIVHLHPDHFPMDMIWLTGKMSIEELKSKHSLQYKEMEAELRNSQEKK